MTQHGALSSLETTSQDNSILLNIPPELRFQILELALDLPPGGVSLGRPDRTNCQDAMSIFLVSKQIYAEAAPIFYRTARIDLRGCSSFSKTSPEKAVRRFLQISERPRRHIRDLSVSLGMADCCECESLVGLQLEKQLDLRSLNVFIGPDYAYPPVGCAVHPPTRPRHFFKSHLDSGEQVTGPICLKETQYQAFLQFLTRANFGKIVVKVHRFHVHFLCQFHVPDKGRNCYGEWRGPEDWVIVDHEAMIEALTNVQVDDSVAAEKGCVVYSRRV
ncbi:hypothetical protein PFICI_06945 [Pestalotiopsis fici W106-1]|uniref:F-box domain-containing protein n=1 Tax=Pestalotiopsis fici (strain W106-1 / CGMCC3.15140) TaxID=1229662 RepID=W3X752_PESFW|nr:uncharacterized protein PFICI_06945 [Pestalotiopsis fici W106-1]ETS81943.1 hypothetical protein PFICI_06945 [Pestalotiopsis fici W106-1]